MHLVRSPRPSPDGRTLAFVAWDHPNMPWDDAFLYLMDVQPDGTYGMKCRDQLYLSRYV